MTEAVPSAQASMHAEQSIMHRSFTCWQKHARAQAVCGQAIRRLQERQLGAAWNAWRHAMKVWMAFPVNLCSAYFGLHLNSASARMCLC